MENNPEDAPLQESSADQGNGGSASGAGPGRGVSEDSHVGHNPRTAGSGGQAHRHAHGCSGDIDSQQDVG